MTSPCPMSFCQCETMFFSPWSFQPDPVSVQKKVYILFIFIIVTVLAGVKLGTQWFISKDFFPLKERSPILCIMLVMSICGQILLYPTLFISNYFTNIVAEKGNTAMFKFRSFQAALQDSAFLIYFVRCMRITYAHQTNKNKSSTLAFKIFKREYLLATLIAFVGFVKAIIVMLDHFSDEQKDNNSIVRDFSLSVELQIPLSIQSMHVEIQHILRTTVAAFFWHCILSYCLFLQRKVSQRYSMKKELVCVLLANLAISSVNIVFLYTSIFQEQDNNDAQIKPLMNFYCNYDYYPKTQVIKILNLVLLMIISIILPLREKKVYHSLLPTGRHYGFIKTMRDFLMEEQFLRIFTAYLETTDKKNQTKTNIALLSFWKQMILLKLNRKESEDKKLKMIRELIDQVKDTLFIDQSELIINLKGSILGLQGSEENTDLQKIKFRESINQKVDELQKMALERLDRIYTKKYIFTESYQHLRKITENYKQINLNMIMLNLALIVDSQSEFT